MTLIQSFILGIIEGLTEFLPVSSTAHLELGTRLLGLVSTDFIKSFEIIIQLGAILAVVVIYWSRLSKNRELWKRIITAFIPTGIIGFVLYKLIKSYLLGNIHILIWTLGIGGIILIIFELIYHEHHDRLGDSITELETMTYGTALLIGIAQSVAVVPGVSRSAATIIAGRTLGISRKAIVEFSFLLAIPTMLAATGYDLLKNASSFSVSEAGALGVGFVVAVLFGVYRIALAIIIYFYLY
jgi:undecaprenyl-diphosphatase